MNSRQIECFLTAAENLNFTAASNILFLSQSNMSRNISQLEEELGVQLFERQRNKVALTKAGSIMFNTFSQIEKYLDMQLELAKNDGEPSRGKLRIGMLYFMDLNKFFMKRLEKFKADHPEIDVEITAVSQKPVETILESGDVDIIISHGFNKPASDNIISNVVWKTPICLAIPKKNPLIESPEELSKRYHDTNIYITRNTTRSTKSSGVINIINRLCAWYNLGECNIIAADYDTNLINASIGKGILVIDGISMLKLPESFQSIELDSEEFSSEITINWAKNNFNPAISMFVTGEYAQESMPTL